MTKPFLLSLSIAISAPIIALGASAGTAAVAAKSTWNFNVWGGKRAFTAGIESIKADLEKPAAAIPN